MLQLFGDKIQARALAQRSNVPVVRGSGNLTSGEECLGILNNGDVRLPAIMKVSSFAIGWLDCFEFVFEVKLNRHFFGTHLYLS